MLPSGVGDRRGGHRRSRGRLRPHGRSSSWQDEFHGSVVTCSGPSRSASGVAGFIGRVRRFPHPKVFRYASISAWPARKAATPPIARNGPKGIACLRAGRSTPRNHGQADDGTGRQGDQDRRDDLDAEENPIAAASLTSPRPIPPRVGEGDKEEKPPARRPPPDRSGMAPGSVIARRGQADHRADERGPCWG